MANGFEATSEYEKLLSDLAEEKKKKEEGTSRAKKLDAAAKALDALTQYGTKSMQAKVQAAAPQMMQFEAPKSTYTPIEYEPEDTSVMEEALNKAKLKKLFGPKAKEKDFTLGPGQVRYTAEGKEIVKGPEKKKSGKREYSKEELAGAHGLYEQMMGVPAPTGLNPKDILDNVNTIMRKTATGIQKERLGQGDSRISQATKRHDLNLLKESRQDRDSERNFKFKADKYARDISSLSEKAAGEYKGIVSEQQYLNRIDKLSQAVLTGKKAYYKDLIKDWIPEAQHDEAFVRLNTLSGQALFSYIKSISGAQFSDAERVRFEQLLPNVGDNPTKFKAKIQEWKTSMKQKRKVFDDGLRVQKIVIPNLWGLEKETGPYGDTVTKNGKNYKWNATAGKYQLLSK